MGRGFDSLMSNVPKFPFTCLIIAVLITEMGEKAGLEGD